MATLAQSLSHELAHHARLGFALVARASVGGPRLQVHTNDHDRVAWSWLEARNQVLAHSRAAAPPPGLANAAFRRLQRKYLARFRSREALHRPERGQQSDLLPERLICALHHVRLETHRGAVRRTCADARKLVRHAGQNLATFHFRKVRNVRFQPNEHLGDAVDTCVHPMRCDVLGGGRVVNTIEQPLHIPRGDGETVASFHSNPLPPNGRGAITARVWATHFALEDMAASDECW
mmetsp:Transcript_60965/g.170541  ORF Transcript_60965/g.170541 Transcript_60965/m.170541 type:complete len:235 (+) Transcript_60965:394-1098(+)